MSNRLLSLAAGTVRDATRLEAVEVAASSGFGALGLRFDLDPPPASELAAIARRLQDTGLEVLDVEAVRLSPEWDLDFERRLIEQAHAVGARHLLVVSDDADRARAIDGLRRISTLCREAGLYAVLEFMKFTHPSTLGEAVDWVREVGSETVGVLVDALHPARSGGHPEQLAAHGDAPGEPFPYAQLCDANRVLEDESRDALIAEARHGRLLPGGGRASPRRSGGAAAGFDSTQHRGAVGCARAGLRTPRSSPACDGGHPIGVGLTEARWGSYP